MTAALREDSARDHAILTDLAGAVLGMAIAVLLVVATLSGAALLLVRWAAALGH